ncbi:MAG: hypothetical protein ABII76_27370 [Pseudomonadota bacterium]
MRIYVASSWRNEYLGVVIARLRLAGHKMFDFRDPDGAFSWANVDPKWTHAFLQGLNHPEARRGFSRDMAGLRGAEVVLLVLPCGRSAHLEAGWAKGSGKPFLVYLPEPIEAELMYGMADLVTDDLSLIIDWLQKFSPGRGSWT